MHCFFINISLDIVYIQEVTISASEQIISVSKINAMYSKMIIPLCDQMVSLITMKKSHHLKYVKMLYRYETLL